MNINTKSYWDNRFATGDWETKQGRLQTRHFAEAQVKLLDIDPNFDGTLLDFGCGLGDAMPVYRRSFPKARLVGVDISTAGIERCREQYGNLAEFIAGDHTTVPDSDVIIASNVFEHLTNNEEIASHLLGKCRRLIIIVPYRETLIAGTEHVNRYDAESFSRLPKTRHIVFASRGWTQYGFNLCYNIWLKNLAKYLLCRPLVRRGLQILFEFVGSSDISDPSISSDKRMRAAGHESVV